MLSLHFIKNCSDDVAKKKGTYFEICYFFMWALQLNWKMYFRLFYVFSAVFK